MALHRTAFGLARRVPSHKREFLTSVSSATFLVAGVLATFNSANAQTQTAQAPAVAEEIVVTGTRVVRDGYQAPTPLTVIGIEQIEGNARANLADFVNELPALAGSTTPQNTSGGRFSGTPGLNILNLRNLGADRTLILIDGQRSVGSTAGGRVDVNDIPQALVSRVDIVTGGAASAYGSDAFSGVVNFVLDKTYTGIKGEVAGGMTQYKDAKNWKASLTAGFGFSGGRGHVLVSAEAAHSAFTLFGDKRDWALTGLHVMDNPDYTTTNGQPFYIVRAQTSRSNIAPGGLITGGPLKGIAFGPDGTPYQWDYGYYGSRTGNFQLGGNWATNQLVPFTTADAGVDRQSLFTRVSYDVTDNVNLFVQWNWAFSDTLNVSNFKNEQGTLTIQRDNAFLPQTIRDRMVTLNLTSFAFGAQLRDFDLNYSWYDRMVNRIVAGANGGFDAFGTDWSWDAYYQYGYAMNSNRYDERLAANFTQAMDSVMGANGVPICRSTLTNPGNGCLPFNPFGDGRNSEAATLWIEETNDNRWNFKQTVIAANLNGEPFSTWAGPVSMAVGVEHRVEDGGGRPMNPESLNRLHTGGNTAPIHGNYSVTEGYAETVVPLAANTSFATALDVNAAVRATDYSTSGYVTTWKVGVSYSPIDDIRFRVTRSRDIRAPNRQELFTERNDVRSFIQDPFNGLRLDTYLNVTGGNPNLKPEIGDTWGLGVVLQPTFLPGFSASVDYFRINVKDAIGSIGSQQTLDQCFAGVTALCSNVYRDAAGHIFEIWAVPSNFVSQLARGMDFEASYRFGLDDIVSSWQGDVAMRVLATHGIELTTDNGLTRPSSPVGNNSGSGPAKWRYSANISYTLDPIRAALTVRGVSSGFINNNWVECSSGCPVSTTDNRTIDSNRIDGAMYLDGAFNYTVAKQDSLGADIEVFFNVKNILNKDPPPNAPTISTTSFYGPPDNPSMYDRMGRTFQAGVRFRM